MPNTIPIEVSARHVHLSHRDRELLFGKGYQLTLARRLSEPENFVCAERVTLQTSTGVIENVAIVGPGRAETQIELSLTDCRMLGIQHVPTRASGEIELDGTPPITIKTDKTRVHVAKGVIISWRHVHMNHTQALELNLKDGQLIKVRVSGPRALVFEHVLVRVAADYELAMQIDTDEANAVGFTLTDTPPMGEIVGIET